MIAAGWYYAEGDPPGTQRYWDGEIWVGQPVYEAMPTPVGVPPPPIGYVPAPPGSGFPEAAKVVAILLSVLKAIPLVFVAIAFFWVLAVSNDINDEFDEFDEWDLDGLFDAAAVILGAILVVGLLLLLFQFIGAIRERPIMLFIPALIMSLIDGGLALLSWIGIAQNGSSGGAFLITAIAAAQIYVMVSALRANTR